MTARRVVLDPVGGAFDAWVAGMGGYAGARLAALHREAVEFAGPDYWAYLDMARRVDEEHAAGAGRWLAEVVRLANARRAARRAEAAAAATLRRVTEIQLAAARLGGHPRLAADPDFGTRTGMSSAEAALELRAAMGLANRAPSAYQAMLPPVGDLARAIGVKS
ncbi:hypothetical protein [Trebonia sp.]|uniref:hypothetical protein n=1 Tax=Trebonia sp. TaxID=2767075 RepID=UPI002606ECC6|nr:hypothetical protein [Trebonia sp.]